MEQSYKEKYEQALSKAKDMLNYKEVRREDMEYIFPELAESEDEKIRKTLIKFFSMGAKNNLHTYGIADKDIIAWLEKQAEQKPADTVEPKFKVGDKIYLKPEYRMPDDDTPIANTVKEIRRIDDKHYRFDGSYIFIEDQDKYELVEQKVEENNGNIVGISSNPEWSEEDEQHVDSLLKRLDALCRNKFERTRFAISEDKDWLKSLKGRVQPKQEWSEEDSQYIDDAFTLIGFGLSTHTTGEVQEWLLSLKGRVKPQWKPSDVQIECLSDAIEHYNSLGYPASKLKELLNDLKKLKGEV